jgi:hypothetical protein
MDEIIGFIIKDENNQKCLNLYSIDQGNINLETTTLLPSNNFDEVAKFGDYLALIAEDDGEIQICEINQDFSLDYVHLISTGEDCRVVAQTDQCSNNEVFITSEIDNEITATIYNSNIPFNEIGSFSLEQFGSCYSRLYRLSDDRVLIFGWVLGTPSQCYNKLAAYNSPDDIQILDNFTFPDGYFKLHDDILIKSTNRSGNVDFVSWQNDEFETLGSHEFPVETKNCFFDFDNGKTYTFGRYNVQEYSCDFVSVEGHQIPVFDTQLSNYPNPFNPCTVISFTLSTELNEQNKQIEIDVYNLKGQKVKTLTVSPSQSHQVSVTWDGTDKNNHSVASGVYFYQLKVDGKAVASRKCLLLK